MLINGMDIDDEEDDWLPICDGCGKELGLKNPTGYDEVLYETNSEQLICMEPFWLCKKCKKISDQTIMYDETFEFTNEQQKYIFAKGSVSN